MRSFKLLSLLILVGIYMGAAQAQTKKTTPKKSTVPKTSTVPPLDVRVAREKVSNQLENMNRFVDVLGPVAQGIETLDESAKTKHLSRSTLDQNEASKQKVITAIRNFRSGLSDLESDFRTKSALKKYLPTIQGISDLMARSEDMAIAGKFVASKEPMRQTATKLSDTLAVLPK